VAVEGGEGLYSFVVVLVVLVVEGKGDEREAMEKRAGRLQTLHCQRV
jgi:hypothetical protein